MTRSSITAKRSSSEGQVALVIDLKASGWPGSISARIKANAEVTSYQARELAAQLIALADEADAKTADRKAREERRKKWCDREIAAGRMVVFGRQS